MSGDMSPWALLVTVAAMSSIVTPRRKFLSLGPFALKVKVLVLVVWVSIDWPWISMTCASSDLL